MQESKVQTPASAPSVRSHDDGPAWPFRLGSVIQHAAELLTIGLVLAALCIIMEQSPLWNIIGGIPNAPGEFASAINAHFFAVGGGVLLVIVLGYLTCRGFWLGGTARLIRGGLARPLLSIIGAGVLIEAIVYLYLWPKMFGYEVRFFLPHGGIEAGFWTALAILILLARYCRCPLVFYGVVLALLSIFFGCVYWFHMRPILENIDRNFNAIPLLKNSLLRPGIMIPSASVPLGRIFLVLIPFLAALYAVHGGFAWWKALAGWLAGWVFTYSIMTLALPPISCATVGTLGLGMAFFGVMVRLPGQRRALERLTGLRFGGGEVVGVSRLRADINIRQKPGHPNFSAFAGHVMLGLLALALAGYTVIGFYERGIERWITQGPPAPSYSPAQVNAYTIMKPWFDKQKSPRLDLRHGDDYLALENNIVFSRAGLDELKGLIDMAAVEKDVLAAGPALDCYIRGANADYCLFHEPGRAVIPNFINLRTVARGLAVRADLRIMQGRTTESLADIETNFKMAALLNSDPCGMLVPHMIAVAIRGLAEGPVQTYFNYYRNDPAALGQLKAMLERNAVRVRVSFPDLLLSRSEPGFWPVVPYFENVIPGLVKACTAFYSRWSEFDALLLATTLELYRHDHKQYPARLEDLAPQYLAQIPHEPFEGRAYEYVNKGAEFELRGLVPRDESYAPAVLFSSAPDPGRDHKALERYKARKTVMASKSGTGVSPVIKNSKKPQATR